MGNGKNSKTDEYVSGLDYGQPPLTPEDNIRAFTNSTVVRGHCNSITFVEGMLLGNSSTATTISTAEVVLPCSRAKLKALTSISIVQSVNSCNKVNCIVKFCIRPAIKKSITHATLKCVKKTLLFNTCICLRK